MSPGGGTDSQIVNQNGRTVSGTVADDTGEPLIGVSVQIQGTTTGTITDFDGKFSLSVPDNATLIVSYIGYKTQHVKVGSQRNLKIVLKQDNQLLDEVVVIGYGTVKKRDLTGSVSSVSGKEIAANPVANVTEALQGHMPGVVVSALDGRPGADVSIKIRGGGSITQSNNPIYIVDGFPASGISDIPADQIESIDVLKDASSTAIYGARGANGVILVTTKGAKNAEKVSVQYSAYMQVKSVAHTRKAMTEAQDYVNWSWGYASLLSDTGKELGTSFFGLGNDPNAGENWARYGTMKLHDYRDDLLRDVVSHNHNLTVTSGSEKTKMLFAVNYMDDPGIRIESGYSRWNARLNMQQQIAKNVKFGADIRYARYTIEGKNDMDELAKAYNFGPLLEPLGDAEDFSAWSTSEGNVNPVYSPEAVIRNITQKNVTDRFKGQFTLNWEIVKGLTLNDEFGIGRSWNEEKYYDAGTASSSYKSAKLTQKNGWNMRNAVTLNYNVQGLGEDHSLNLLAGQEFVASRENKIWIYGAGYPESFGFSDAFGMITMTDTSLGKDERGNQIGTPERTLSYFGRVNYSYKGKYLLTATFRADGSTKFASNNRWGYFPAAALGWRISDEGFMEGTKDWLDNLKLRLSYGESGADNINSSLWKDTWTTSTAKISGNVVTTYIPGELMPNPDLKWETTVSRNIGLDFGLFNNRLNGNLDFYYNSNKDLLIRVPVDPSTGYSYQFQNVGETSNKGIELAMNYALIQRKDFNLKIGLNYNFNRNNIERLASNVSTEYGNGIWASTDKLPYNEFRLLVGHPVGTIVSYENQGYYQLSDFNYDANTGVYTLKEGVADFPFGMNYPSGIKTASGQKAFPGCLKVATKEDGSARLKEIDLTAKHTGGFSLSGNYKNVDFSANFAWQLGGKVYNAQAMNDYFGNKETHLGKNHYDYFADSYRTWEVTNEGQLMFYTDPENLTRINAGVTYALPTFEHGITLDNWVEDASYLRLNTLTVGYTFPKEWMKKIYIQNLRVYATAGNLFCLNSYSGDDPEVGAGKSRGNFLISGTDMGSYPRARTFTFGLSVSF